MYQKVDFTKLGGFPLTQNTMNYLQNSYNNVLEALSRVIGNYVIISGVTQIDANVWSEGWLTYDNKIVPFQGGNQLNFIKIVENVDSVTFRNQVIFPIATGYTAVFDDTEGIPFSFFQRLSLTSLNDYIDTTNTLASDAFDLATTLSASAVPPGIITMWAGTTPPATWKLCTGGTYIDIDNNPQPVPDLRGRFIVGYNPSDTDYNLIGKNGGSKNVTLTIDQMPSHSHTMQTAGNHSHTIRFNGRERGSTGSANLLSEFIPLDRSNSAMIQSAGDHTHIINSNGSNQPHENRPPYYTLAYIIKSKF